MENTEIMRAKALGLAIDYKKSCFSNSINTILIADLFLAYIEGKLEDVATIKETIINDMKKEHEQRLDHAKSMVHSSPAVMEYAHSSFTI